ncbi:hypothetical protein BGZ79_006493 [Entomortierella chlamydospora]|nr:hypothetical protein BGZ79_006493 [Entomortierella chlamydospora]
MNSTTNGVNLLGNTTQSSGHGASSSNSVHLIDLTVPTPPRIIHPRVLPSQSVEIIEIDSEDEEPRRDYTHQDGEGDEEVQFLHETPAPMSSWESRGPLQPSIDNLLLRYFSEQNVDLFASPSRTQAERGRQSPDRASQSRDARLNLNNNAGMVTGETTSGTDPRRPLRDRVLSSGIWNTHGTSTGSTDASVAAQRRLSNQLEEAADAASYLRHYLTLFRPSHDYEHHPYRQRHRRPRRGWLFGEDPIDYIPFTDDFFSRRGSPEAQASTMNAEQDEPEHKPLVPARPGHTKTLSQDVILACPVCKNELGYGKENTKLWVVIGCGHVICGDCIESVFLSKVMKKKPASKKSKNKGKAKWTAPVDTEEDSGVQGEGETNGESKAMNTEVGFKMVMKQSGHCPSCSRSIRKTSIQQLYL